MYILSLAGSRARKFYWTAWGRFWVDFFCSSGRDSSLDMQFNYFCERRRELTIFIRRIYFGFQTPFHCVSQSATLIIIILHEASATICRVCVCILQHRHGELFSLFLLHEIIIIWLCLWSWLRFPIRRSCPSLLISRRGAQSEKKRVRIFILCTSTTNRPMSTNDGGRGNGEERAEFLFCSFLFFLSRAYNFFKIAWCVFYARRAASRIARLSSRSAH